jgi:hypothetical protein
VETNGLARGAFVSFFLSGCPRFSAKLLVLHVGKTEIFRVVMAFLPLETAVKFLLQN